MKAVLVIDVDKEELGDAIATITAKENDITFFAEGVIRPLPKKWEIDYDLDFGGDVDYGMGWNHCLEEITGETE